LGSPALGCVAPWKQNYENRIEITN